MRKGRLFIGAAVLRPCGLALWSAADSAFAR